MADNTELVEIRTSLPRAGRPPHDFRSIWSSTDEGTCKPDCEKKDVCSKFRMFIAGLETGKSSQEREHTERIERKHQDLKKDLYKFLTDGNISLVDELCNGKEDQEQISVLETLLTLNEGCEIITEQLNDLKKSESSKSANVEVLLGSGKLFDPEKPCSQSRILAELMGVRNRTEEGRSLNSLTALIKHPVLIIFIREKWEKIKFAFFFHLRLWMLFLLAFSLFLRVEVNKQIERKQFNATNGSNGSTPLCFDKTQDCHYFKLKKDTKNCSEPEGNDQITVQWICPKDPNFSQDSSRKVLAVMIFFFGSFLLVKGFWVAKDYWFRAGDNKKYRKSTYMSRFLTLVATTVGIVFLSVAFSADGKKTPLVPSTPLIDKDDGLVFLQWVLVFFAVYFSGMMVLKAHCFHIFENKMIIDNLTDPQHMMTILTLGPALAAVFGKNELMATDNNGFINGLTSISIAMAAGVLVIQIGCDGETFFGQFATMFHLTLRKIPAHVFAVMYLLHGFSFGFWLLENRLAQEDEEQAFTDYWRSIITVVSMAFGLTEFNFDGPFDYNHKEDDYGGHINTIFAYILILLMVLLVLLGLLNLLLSSIIRDHKEMKASVDFMNIIFMAQYAVWADYYIGVWFGCLPTVRKWISLQTEIKKDKTVRYCALPFCANAVKDRASPRNIGALRKKPDDQLPVKRFRHMEPHLDWVLTELQKIPDQNKTTIKNSQVDTLIAQIRDKAVKQRATNDEEEEMPMIRSLQRDGEEWTVSFE